MVDVIKKLKELGYYEEGSKKEKIEEAITIASDSPQDLPVLARIMKLAGLQQVTPDMMPAEEPASDCGCGDGNTSEEEAEEGYANSMGNEKEEPTYKAYDGEEYALQRDKGLPRKFSMRGDNPLTKEDQDKLAQEALATKADNIYKEYKEFVAKKKD